MSDPSSPSSAKSVAAPALADAVHDIGNALNGLVGMVQLAHQLATSQTQRRYLELAEQSAQTLAQLLQRTLLETRAEGVPAAPPVRFELDAMLAEVLRSASAGMGWRDFALVYDYDGPLVKIEASALDLRQLLLNLVDNAARHTEQGHVGVSVWVDPGVDGHCSCRLLVEDTGCGMDASRLARLFEAGEAADATRLAAGHGRGMLIVQRLVQRLGGTISVDSTPGVGTRVTLQFRWPLQAQLAAPVACSGQAWLVYATPHLPAFWLQRRLARRGWPAELVDGVDAALARAAMGPPPSAVLVAAHSLSSAADLHRLQAALPASKKLLLSRLDWREPLIAQQAQTLGWTVLPVPVSQTDLLQLTSQTPTG
jgi:anti-sigma regulatory factor (Ser/Thr protein kinase)